MGHMVHPGLSSVPPELWLRVCSFLDLPDAGNFRLVCRTFGDLGAPVVLRRLIVHATADDDHRLRALARNPAKAKYLQSLIYTPIPVRNSPIGHRPSRLVSSDPLVRQREYAKLRQLRNVHADIQSNPLICESLPDVFPNLTGLKSVIINCEGWHQSSNRYGAGGKGAPLSLIHRQFGKPGSRVLAVLLRALEDNKAKLETLKAGRVEWRSLGDLPRTLVQLDLFSNLADLNLHFCVCAMGCSGVGAKHPDRVEYAHKTEAGTLPNFLGALPRLRALAIAFCMAPNNAGMSEAWLRDIVRRGQHWPLLTSLSFGGMNLTRSLLMDILARHKGTLRRLELFNVWLDSHWPSALAEIRDMLSLEDTTIWGGLGCDRGWWNIMDHPGPDYDGSGNVVHAIRKYMLHGDPCHITAEAILADGLAMFEPHDAAFWY